MSRTKSINYLSLIRFYYQDEDDGDYDEGEEDVEEDDIEEEEEDDEGKPDEYMVLIKQFLPTPL